MAVDLPPGDARAWHRRIWQLTWPVIIANLTIPLVGVADVWVMGRLPQPKFIAAVALGAALFSAVYWLFGFLRMGTTGLTAQAFGASTADDEQSHIAAIAARSMLIALVLAAVMLLLQWPLQQLLFYFFAPGHELGALAGQYYQIRIWGAPALLVYLVELGVLFGLQRMRDTLWLSVGFNLTNLTLDLLFVLGLGMDVRGVALGTLLSEWGAAVAGAWFVWRALRSTGWTGTWPGQVWLPSKVRALFHLSSNLILRTFFVQMPFLIGTKLATGIDTTTLAAHAVLMQLFFIMTYGLDAFAHTAETLTGYWYGARAPQQLRRAATYATLWALLLAIALGLGYLLLGPTLIEWFTVSPSVQATAQSYLVWVALSPLFCVWAFMFDGIFIGTTHIVEMRNAMIAAAVLWALLLWWTFPAYGYAAVWWSMNFFMLARGVLLALLYPRIERHAAAAG